MDEKKRILIVEDDAAISDIVVYNLMKEGFEALAAYDGETGLSMALNDAPDLILLDLMLPGINGFEICRRVREVSDVPILMLTAREGEDDKVEGLELGADDYITKPFLMRELISRVRANLRRSTGALVPAASAKTAREIAVDEKSKTVSVCGKSLDVSAREYELLRYLTSSPDTVFTREDILRSVYGYEYDGGTRIVDVAVRRLREKLEECAEGAGRFIATRHGVGYYYDPQGK
ncbi:MAG: response regulator transcription factor [Ruminococcaceae bacterium]|nr:response regulator transcription factor [Oscillospiraceae bacterium]MBQ4048630.1 response regulator transcription factor [Clostridia bacterium]